MTKHSWTENQKIITRLLFKEYGFAADDVLTIWRHIVGSVWHDPIGDMCADKLKNVHEKKGPKWMAIYDLDDPTPVELGLRQTQRAEMVRVCERALQDLGIAAAPDLQAQTSTPAPHTSTTSTFDSENASNKASSSAQQSTIMSNQEKTEPAPKRRKLQPTAVSPSFSNDETFFSPPRGSPMQFAETTPGPSSTQGALSQSQIEGSIYSDRKRTAYNIGQPPAGSLFPDPKLNRYNMTESPPHTSSGHTSKPRTTTTGHMSMLSALDSAKAAFEAKHGPISAPAPSGSAPRTAPNTTRRQHPSRMDRDSPSPSPPASPAADQANYVLSNSPVGAVTPPRATTSALQASSNPSVAKLEMVHFKDLDWDEGTAFWKGTEYADHDSEIYKLGGKVYSIAHDGYYEDNMVCNRTYCTSCSYAETGVQRWADLGKGALPAEAFAATEGLPFVHRSDLKFKEGPPLSRGFWFKGTNKHFDSAFPSAEYRRDQILRNQEKGSQSGQITTEVYFRNTGGKGGVVKVEVSRCTDECRECPAQYPYRPLKDISNAEYLYRNVPGAQEELERARYWREMKQHLQPVKGTALKEL